MVNILLIGFIIIIYILCGHFIHSKVLDMIKYMPNDTVSKSYQQLTHKQKMIMYYSFLFLWLPGLIMQILYYIIIAIGKYYDE